MQDDTREEYEITLSQPDANGSRAHVYPKSAGNLLTREPNGVLVVFNEKQCSVVEYSPYAWLFVQTTHIDNLEDMND
jgi:hypothetical protein